KPPGVALERTSVIGQVRFAASGTPSHLFSTIWNAPTSPESMDLSGAVAVSPTFEKVSVRGVDCALPATVSKTAPLRLAARFAGAGADPLPHVADVRAIRLTRERRAPLRFIGTRDLNIPASYYIPRRDGL